MIKTINKENFKKYGYVLEFSEECSEEFEIIVREDHSPWRLAVYRPSDKACTFLEKHPDSMESFEPFKGVAVLLVAEEASPEEYEAFLLDKPICLYKGIWHNAIAISNDIIIRVTENAEVESEFHRFDAPVRISVGANT